MSTLYASFADFSAAEKAAGALLDHGVKADDISLLANEKAVTGQPIAATRESQSAERSAKSGISTTTSGDVLEGSVKGATIGLGLGALAVAATLFIPGVGLVVGGGALAAALMGGAGTAVAGAAVGGVAGLLTDQGVPEEVVTHYSNAFVEGGSIVAVAIPSNNVDSAAAEAILMKYGASNIATVNAARVQTAGVHTGTPDPLIVQDANPDIASAAFGVPAPVAVVTTPIVTSPVVAAPVIGTPIDTNEVVVTSPGTAVVVPTAVTSVVQPLAGTSVEPSLTTDPLAAAADPLSVLVPENSVVVTPVRSQVTTVDGISEVSTAEPYVDVVDSVTGDVYRRPVETVMPDLTEDSQMTTLSPNAEVIQDQASGVMHQTVGKPTVISSQPVVVTDPVTGQRKAAKIVESQHAVEREAVGIDEDGHAVLPVEGAGETVIVREKHIELL